MKKKILIVFFIIIAIIVLIAIIFKLLKVTPNKAYIDIYYDDSTGANIDLYSVGSGINEKLFLGAQQQHYLVFKNGDVYKYKESAYANKITKKKDPPTINKLKTLSKEDINKLETDLNEAINNNTTTTNNTSIFSKVKYHVIINKEENVVDRSKISEILKKYFE